MESVVRQPNTIILPDTNFFYPPSTLLTGNFPFCESDGHWLDYLLLLQMTRDTPCLKKVAIEVASYTDVVRLLQHENVYTTAGVARELQNAIRFFSRKYRASVNGGSPEDRIRIRGTIKETVETYRQLRRFLLDRMLEGCYLDSLGIYCKRDYSTIQEAIKNAKFPDNDEPDDTDKELIGMALYIASLSSRQVVTLSSDHHIYQGIPRVCQYLPNSKILDRLSSRLSVMGINGRTGRLEVKH